MPGLDLDAEEGSCHGEGLDTGPGLDIGAEEASAMELDWTPCLDWASAQRRPPAMELDWMPCLEAPDH